ncbi:MAG TPA: hypothetical protein VFC78_10440 [Tepidisphaeraceae bacterium]|nr:hypothetical protein [Tepidisphaeraceae bacterium]
MKFTFQAAAAAAAALLACVFLTARACAAPASQPAADAARTGQFHVTFTQRSPESRSEKLGRRLGWALDQLKKTGVDPEYDLEKESFEVYVPSDYDGNKPYGLFVWVSASPSGMPHENWLDGLDKRHLIWIGANNAGNPRTVTIRLGLAIDAVHNMKLKYALDENRIYVSGASGGGRCSSILGVSCPDIFRGGFYMIGCDYFRPISTGEPNQFWRPNYVKPAPKLFALASRRSRHVLLTGETDMNRPQTKGNYEQGFLKDGFKNVLYLEVPGMGHRPPPADWFEKGVAFLDERPRGGAATVSHPAPTSRPAALASRQPALPKADAHPIESVPTANPDDDVPAKLLRMAKLYLSNNRPDDARMKLRDLTKKYPNSPASDEARNLLIMPFGTAIDGGAAILTKAVLRWRRVRGTIRDDGTGTTGQGRPGT